MGAVIVMLLLGAAMAGVAGLDAAEEAITKGGAGGDGFAGSEGDDSFAGGGGNDLLIGRDGDDSLSGDAGHDWLIGLGGADQLSGGDGDDVIIGGEGSDMIDTGSGNDFVESANIVDEAALVASLDGVRSISAIDFRYALPGGSDAPDDVLLGDGDDTVVAGNGDVLTGNAGADEFTLGDWIEGGDPVEITDFDAAEDIIAFIYDTSGPAPDLTIDRNARTGVTLVRAGGETIAVVRDTSPGFSLSNIAVSRYAAA